MKSKRLLLMLLMALLVPWAANAQSDNSCEISYALVDSYGDGWNGGQMVVTDVTTSTPLATLTISSGSSANGSIEVINGHDIVFSYTEGQYAYENSWTIYDVTGAVIWEGSGSDGDQTHTYTAVCPSCLPPADLTATLTEGNGTIATLSWTQAGDATNWVLEYGTSANLVGATSVNVSGTPSKDLTGLTPETKYYARVKADCGGGDESDWTEAINFKPTNKVAEDYTVYENASATNEYVPFYGYYADATQQNQMIFPASDLADLDGGEITQMVFYIASVSGTQNIGNWIVSLGETTATTLDGLDETTPLTQVYSGPMNFNSGETLMTVTFTEAFEYNGGNLLVEFNHPVAAGYKRYYFTGVTAEGASYCYTSQRNFLPKVTFTYYPNPIQKPKNLTFSNLTAQGVKASWTAPNSNVQSYEYQYGAGEDWTSWTSTTATSVVLSGLTPDHTYTFRVKAIYAEGTSNYSEGSFTTLESCVTPTGLTASNVTAHEATITWTSAADAWQICVNDDEENLIDVTETTYNFTGLTPETAYTVKVRTNCGNEHSDWATVNFTTGIACPAPTGFAAMPNSITAHTANLTWQGTSNSYQVAYRTAAYTDGIEEGFGSTVPVDWTRYNTLLTDEVLNGTTALSPVTSGWVVGTSNGVFDSHARVNIYGSSCKYWLVTPTLTVPAGAAFSFDLALTAYSGTNVPAPATTGTDDKFIVLISTDEMATWTILREWNNSGSEYVYNNIANTATGENVSFDFSAYAGQTVYVAFYGESTVNNADNNLHIDNVTIGTPVEAGEWQYMTEVTEVPCQLTGLLAERKYEATLQGDCGNEGPSTVVGPITFTTAISCLAPTALNHANVKSAQVDLSWTTGGAEDWVLAYKKTDDANFTEVNLGTEDVTIEGTTVTYTLTGLDEETAYTVKVRDNCEASIPGDGMSAWTATTSFTTMAACAVDNVTVSNISHYAATINWDGESNKGFTVKYRTAEHVDGVSEDFSGTSLPTDWTMYTGQLSGNTATLSSHNYSWAFGTDHGVFDSHARVNIYGSNYRWLITPEITLADNAGLSFDMALTCYSSSSFAPQTSGTDDKFIVLISSDNMATWTTLREWNNAGTGDAVYNDIANTTTGENVNIDLSSYSGKTVYVAFYGESTVSNADNYLHIDNVTIGTPVEAGSWQENETNESPYIISGLEPGTKYDLKVAPICDETLVSEIQQFTTVSADEKWFITEGNWGTAANWEPAGVPTIEQTVELRANATIESGCVAEAKSISGTGTGDNAKTLTIEDGGQLKHNSSNVRATVKKNIAGYENYTGDKIGGYYLIANPITSNYTPKTDGTDGFLVGNYDLYSFAYTNDMEEWRNYKANQFSSLNSAAYNSYGYLYANEAGTTLTFNGNIKAANASLYRSCTVPTSGAYHLPGVYLLGNAFVCDAYLATGSATGNGLPCYKMNEAGDGFTAVAAGEPIAPLEGVFFVASSDEGGFSGNVYVTTTAPQVAVAPGELNVTVSQGRGVKDNAIIVFGDNQRLGKFSFREGSTKIYIPMDGKDFAIVNAGQVGEMPVSFKAEKNGSYTLNFASKEVSFSYLHLIDNMTGADVDLLETPTYTFSAKTTDYASRFRLVFATGSSVDGDSFAFINGAGNLSIFGIEGEATVQVMDVLGHMVSSNTFSGSYECKLNVAPGVYMIRLIQGNDVKVQKMVIK